MQHLKRETIKDDLYKNDLVPLLELYFNFLLDPDQASSELHITDSEFTTKFKELTYGLRGTFTRDKSIQTTINFIATTITTMIDNLTNGYVAIKEEFKENLEIIKKNDSIIRSTQDIDIMESRKVNLQGDKVRLEFFGNNIDKIVKQFIGDTDLSSSDVLNGLSNLIDHINMLDVKSLQGKFNILNNHEKLLISNINNNSLLELKLPEFSVTDEYVPTDDFIKDFIFKNHKKTSKSELELINEVIEKLRSMEETYDGNFKKLQELSNEKIIKAYEGFASKMKNEIFVEESTTPDLDLKIKKLIYGIKYYSQLIKLHTIVSTNALTLVNSQLKLRSQLLSKVDEIATGVMF